MSSKNTPYIVGEIGGPVRLRSSVTVSRPVSGACPIAIATTPTAMAGMTLRPARFLKRPVEIMGASLPSAVGARGEAYDVRRSSDVGALEGCEEPPTRAPRLPAVAQVCCYCAVVGSSAPRWHAAQFIARSSGVPRRDFIFPSSWLILRCITAISRAARFGRLASLAKSSST